MPRHLSTFLTLTSSFLIPLANAATQQCYALNGTQLDSTYGPCNPTAKHSGCCAIHRPAGSVELCLDNGLCMATGGQYMGSIWQGGCTDSTGKDEGCPKMCPDVRDDFGGLKPVSAWNIQMCDFGSYCCRGADDRSNCCSDPSAPKISTSSIGAFQFQTSTADVFATPTPTTTTTSPPTSSAPTSANLQVVAGTAVSTGTPFTTSASTSPPSTPDCASERHRTATIGGAVGGVLGAALVGACVAMFWLYKKEKHQRRIKEHYEAQFEVSSAYWPRPRTAGVDAGEEMPRTPVEKEGEVVVVTGEGRGPGNGEA